MDDVNVVFTDDIPNQERNEMFESSTLSERRVRSVSEDPKVERGKISRRRSSSAMNQILEKDHLYLDHVKYVGSGRRLTRVQGSLIESRHQEEFQPHNLDNKWKSMASNAMLTISLQVYKVNMMHWTSSAE